MRSGRKLWGTKLWLLCPVVFYFLIFCMVKAVLGRKGLFWLQRDGVHHGEEGTATEHKAGLAVRSTGEIASGAKLSPGAILPPENRATSWGTCAQIYGPSGGRFPSKPQQWLW